MHGSFMAAELLASRGSLSPPFGYQSTARALICAISGAIFDATLTILPAILV
jgi:hypothetical protein